MFTEDQTFLPPPKDEIKRNYQMFRSVCIVYKSVCIVYRSVRIVDTDRSVTSFKVLKIKQLISPDAFRSASALA